MILTIYCTAKGGVRKPVSSSLCLVTNSVFVTTVSTMGPMEKLRPEQLVKHFVPGGRIRKWQSYLKAFVLRYCPYIYL